MCFQTDGTEIKFKKNVTTEDLSNFWETNRMLV